MYIGTELNLDLPRPKRYHISNFERKGMKTEIMFDRELGKRLESEERDLLISRL